jgi:hypothetical protein
MKISVREVLLLVAIAALVFGVLHLRSTNNQLRTYRGRAILLQHIFEEQGLKFQWDDTGVQWFSQEDDLLVVSPNGSCHSKNNLNCLTKKGLEEFNR